MEEPPREWYLNREDHEQERAYHPKNQPLIREDTYPYQGISFRPAIKCIDHLVEDKRCENH